MFPTYVCAYLSSLKLLLVILVDLEIGFEHSTYTGTEGEEVKVRLVATSEFAKAFQVKIFTTSLLISSPEKPYEAESGTCISCLYHIN